MNDEMIEKKNIIMILEKNLPGYYLARENADKTIIIIRHFENSL